MDSNYSCRCRYVRHRIHSEGQYFIGAALDRPRIPHKQRANGHDCGHILLGLHPAASSMWLSGRSLEHPMACEYSLVEYGVCVDWMRTRSDMAGASADAIPARRR